MLFFSLTSSWSGTPAGIELHEDTATIEQNLKLLELSKALEAETYLHRYNPLIGLQVELKAVGQPYPGEPTKYETLVHPDSVVEGKTAVFDQGVNRRVDSYLAI